MDETQKQKLISYCRQMQSKMLAVEKMANEGYKEWKNLEEFIVIELLDKNK